MSVLRVSEVFGPTVQGEGAQIGRPTVFVRLGGCDYRCSWCDTLYAVLPEYKEQWKPMDDREVWEEIKRLSPYPILVTLSGGNPAIQPCFNLIMMGLRSGYSFCMETQGSVVRPWFAHLDALTISPKPPSSGMLTRWDRLSKCVNSNRKSVLKVVVANETDYQYARGVHQRFPGTAMYLQPCNETVGEQPFDLGALLDKYRWLVKRAAADNWHHVTILPQLHTIVWGNKRGV